MSIELNISTRLSKISFLQLAITIKTINNMTRRIILTLISIFYYSSGSRSQTINFLTELRHPEKGINGTKYWKGSEYWPYDIFKNAYDLKVKLINPKNKYEETGFSCKLYKKETYYQGNNTVGVGVRVIVNPNLFTKERTQFNVKFEVVPLHPTPAWHKEDGLIDGQITLSKTDNIQVVGTETYTIDTDIKWTAPAKYSLPILMKDIRLRLDSLTTENGGYSDIIKELNYYNGSLKDINNTINFYKLAVFLEKNINDESFINLEAIELSSQVSEIENLMSDTIKNRSLSREDLQYYTANLIESNKVLKEYYLTREYLKFTFSKLISNLACQPYPISGSLSNNQQNTNLRRKYISLGIGLPVSIGYNSIDDQFTLVRVGTQTQIQGPDKKSSVSINPALFLHYYPFKKEKWSFLVGLGLTDFSFRQIKLSKYLGVGFRPVSIVNFCAGASVIYVNRLNKPYVIEGLYDNLPSTIFSNVARVSPFVSLSINIGKSHRND